MQAKAMVLREPGQLELWEYDVVAPAADEVLLRLAATSVCMTDTKIFAGAIPSAQFPLIMGHEFAGEVIEIGQQAAVHYDLQPGDRVTVEPYIPCGACQWCRTTYHYHQCVNIRSYGLGLSAEKPPHLFGGYGEYLYLQPGTIIHKLTKDISPLAACLSSVVGNAVRWVKLLGEIRLRQSVVISGVGSQGLCALAVARESGAGPIAVLGLSRDQARFELAREFGADYLINVEKEDPLEVVPDLFGDWPDVVVETSGVPRAIQTAVKLVKTAGRVVMIGLSAGRETSLKFDDLIWRDITIVTGRGQAGNVGDAMWLINEGKYPFEKINNRCFSLDQLQSALELTKNPDASFIKAAIHFEQD